MKTILHKADSRGHADHGWLNAHHSFSFAGWYNPERVHFGALRVLNDDIVDGGMGFGMHPHDNMEIITLPQSGALKHKDSMGNEGIIEAGEMQVMSAGTGIYHSEMNPRANEAVKLFQIWVIPNKQNVTPRYDQRKLNAEDRKNKWQQIISPNADDDGSWIHQDAWFHLGDFDKEAVVDYSLKKNGNGVYAFVIEGSAEIAGVKAGKRDAVGIADAESFQIKANDNVRLLLMEVPMI